MVQSSETVLMEVPPLSLFLALSLSLSLSLTRSVSFSLSLALYLSLFRDPEPKTHTGGEPGLGGSLTSTFLVTTRPVRAACVALCLSCSLVT